MKKILLVDNDKARLKLINPIMVKYTNYVSGLEKLNKGRNDSYVELNEASILLLHKNYFDDGLLATDDIIEQCNKIGTIYKLFSGESGDKEILPVKEMYKNIIPFIECYKNTGELVVEILEKGNLYYMEVPLNIRRDIFLELFDKSENERVVLSDNLMNSLTILMKSLEYSDDIIVRSIDKIKSEYTVKKLRESIDTIIGNIEKRHYEYPHN